MDNELAGQCRLLLAAVVSLVADEVMKRVEVVLDAHVHELDEDRVRALAEQQASAMFIDDRGDSLPRAWSKETLLTLLAEQPTFNEDRVQEMIDENNLDEDRVQEMIDNSLEIDDKIEEYLSNNLHDEVVTVVRDMDFKVTVR